VLTTLFSLSSWLMCIAVLEGRQLIDLGREGLKGGDLLQVLILGDRLLDAVLDGEEGPTIRSRQGLALIVTIFSSLQ
jgi:hypothetical protein